MKRMIIAAIAISATAAMAQTESDHLWLNELTIGQKCRWLIEKRGGSEEPPHEAVLLAGDNARQYMEICEMTVRLEDGIRAANQTN